MKINHLRAIACAIVVAAFAQLASAQWVRLAGPRGPAIVKAIAANETRVFIAVHSGVFASSDKGVHWLHSDSGLTDTSVTSLVAAGETIFAITSSENIFVSYNNGLLWKHIDSFFPDLRIREVSVFNNTVLARNDTGATFLSFNSGTSWKPIPLHKKVNAIVVCGNMMVVGSNSHGVFRSSDNGETWSKPVDSLNFEVLVMSGTTIFGQSGRDVYRSIDTGKTWSDVEDKTVEDLVVVGNAVFAGYRNTTIFRSTDNGDNWTRTMVIPMSPKVRSDKFMKLAVSGTTIFAVTTYGLVKSTDNGDSWNSFTTGVTEECEITALTGKGNTIFAGTENDGVYYSANSGTTWTQVNNGLSNLSISTLKMNDTTVFAGTFDCIFRSTNNGASWSTVDSGHSATSIAIGNSSIYALAGSSSVLISTDNGGHWVSKNIGTDTYSIDVLAARGNLVVAGSTVGGVILSTDNGTTWKDLKTKFDRAIALDEHRIINITPIDLSFSTDNGLNWVSRRPTNFVVTSSYFSSIAISGDKIFVGSAAGVLLTTDNGITWSKHNEGFEVTGVAQDNLFVTDVTVIDNNLFAVGSGLWRRPILEITGIQGGIRPIAPGYTNSLSIQSGNSFPSETIIAFVLPVTKKVEVAVCNITGKKIATLVNGMVGPGLHICQWDRRNVAPGCYVVKMQSGMDVMVKRFTVAE